MSGDHVPDPATPAAHDPVDELQLSKRWRAKHDPERISGSRYLDLTSQLIQLRRIDRQQHGLEALVPEGSIEFGELRTVARGRARKDEVTGEGEVPIQHLKCPDRLQLR